jgi:hypothetical protein
MSKPIKLGLALILIAYVASCGLYNKKFSEVGSPLSVENDFVIQVDDYGSFWDPEVPTRALQKISEESQHSNTIVVLFVHGWHHNAAPDDDNAKDFAHSLQVIRQSRINLSGNGGATVIGIYVGWRGKSLPMPFDYATFWGRKSAAERVGQGDLREFLLRLNQIYIARNGPRERGEKRPFMGMISFGHSFGGQVLFNAVATTFEAELIEATRGSSAGKKAQLTKPLAGFGDMTVLINPALEAFQYERIDRLRKEIAFDRRQTPLLLVLSSETDYARRFFFPLGRTVDAISRAPFRHNQRAEWTQALGEYEPQRTHTVEILTEESSTKFDPARYATDQCAIVNFDLTNVPAIAGVRLAPLGNSSDPFNPFLVVYASGKVIFQHSGIFKSRLRDFLNDYVALAEGKRILLADPDAQKCTQ